MRPFNDYSSPYTTTPLVLRDIISLGFSEYRSRVLSYDHRLLDHIYAGDLLVVRGAYPKDDLLRVRRRAFEHWQSSQGTFHKIYDGVPNFHRIIDEDPNYALKWRVHCQYLFPWNSDDWGVFALCSEMYSLSQIIGGFEGDEFINNTPQDQFITRFQLMQYPSGGGYIQLHDHPVDAFKVTTINILSQYGGTISLVVYIFSTIMAREPT